MKNVNPDRKQFISRISKPLTARHDFQLQRIREEYGFERALQYLLTFSGTRTRVDRAYFRLYTPPREMQSSSRLLELTKHLRNKELHHSPWSDKARFVGVELELCIPRVNMAKLKAFSTFGITLRGDGSLRTDRDIARQAGLTHPPEELDQCIELNILMKQGDYSQLAKILAFLNSQGAYVNSSCGVHVHIDQRHNDKKNAMLVFSRLQNAVAPLLSKLVKQARLTPSEGRTNYCRTNRNSKNKYQAVNFLPYKLRKTIEVRMHHGSLDHAELVNWIETLLMVSEAKGLARPKRQKTWDETLNLISPDKRLVLQEIARRRSEEASQGQGLALVQE